MRSLVVILCLSALSQAEVNAPLVGVVHYSSDATLRPVLGIPASFVAGPSIITGVHGASFSEGGGIVVAADALEIVDKAGHLLASAPCSDSDPILNVADSVSTAVAWLPESRLLASYSDGAVQLTTVVANLPGRVVALRKQGTAAALLVLETGTAAEVLIDLATGNVVGENAIAEVTAPAIYVPEGILFCGAHGLALRDSLGSIRELNPDLQVTRFERMATDWVHASTSDGEFAIHVAGNHVSRLPGAQR